MGKRTVTTTTLECDFCGDYENEAVSVSNRQWYYIDSYPLFHQQFFVDGCVPESMPQRLICGSCLVKLTSWLTKLGIKHRISKSRQDKFGNVWIGEI